jgi:NADPH:quinone reductase-like Zn-dependent oxidoreductase
MELFRPRVVLFRMNAAVFRKYGPPEVVRMEEVPKPVPRGNEVLVRVRAASVCAIDWRVRKGDPFILRILNGLSAPKKNRILGVEFSGTVESVGRSVTRFRIGDDVFACNPATCGGHAEYACIPETGNIEIKPSNMTHAEAAAIAFGGFSALYFLRKANIRHGQQVLIYGASGSVGVFAVQLAKHFGAHVTGVCSTRNIETVKSLGADRVIDYTREDFAGGGRVYDVIFDTVGYSGFSRSMRALRRDGVYVREAPPWWLLASPFAALWSSTTGGPKIIGGAARVSKKDPACLKELIEAGKLRTVIDQCYPLDQIADAHRHAESGHKRGHVVVIPRGE